MFFFVCFTGLSFTDPRPCTKFDPHYLFPCTPPQIGIILVSSWHPNSSKRSLDRLTSPLRNEMEKYDFKWVLELEAARLELFWLGIPKRRPVSLSLSRPLSWMNSIHFLMFHSPTPFIIPSKKLFIYPTCLFVSGGN